MILNSFLFVGSEPKTVEIVDGQLMVAFAASKLLYSYDFGHNWREYQNLPFNPEVYPIVGGSIGMFYTGSGAAGLDIVTASAIYSKQHVGLGVFANGFASYANGSPVKHARGSGDPIYLSKNDNGTYGYPRPSYSAKTVASPIIWANSHGPDTGAYRSDGIIVYNGNIRIWSGFNIAVEYTQPLANVRMGMISGGMPDLIGYFVDSNNDVYLIDFATGATTLKGTVADLSLSDIDPLKYGFDLGKGAAINYQVVAANIISTTINSGSNWTKKVTLDAYTTDARVCKSGQHMIVSTADGKLYVSNDYGNSFQKRYDDNSLVFRSCGAYKGSNKVLDLQTFLN